MEASAFPISGEEQALEKRPKDKRPRGPLDAVCNVRAIVLSPRAG